MTFECDGVRFDTCDMTAYQTGNPGTPTLYLAREGHAIFVMTLDRWRGVSIRRSSLTEARFLATHFHLADLLRGLQTNPETQARGD